MSDARQIDAAVIGAGMGGLYGVRRLLSDGWSVLGFESAADVGGVWLHNAYPGARVDIEAYYYCFLDPEIYGNWEWTERFPAQPEILAYLRYYAEHYDLRRHFRFATRVEQLHWLPGRGRWRLRTDTGELFEACHVVLATGQLSRARNLPFPGTEDFLGEWIKTAHWPNRPVELAGKRVAVIGTGASGAQPITEIADKVETLHVFQRTPHYVVPARNAPIDRDKYARYAHSVDGLWDDVMATSVAYLAPGSPVPATELSPAEQQAQLETNWEFGGLAMTFVFPDQKTSWDTNAIVSNFVRQKIRAVIDDPELADVLEPKDYPIGTRRLVVCDGYYETYNRDNVTLVNLRKEPIERVTETGIQTAESDYEFDLIISALGFDEFTGAIDDIDIRNAAGARPADFWTHGPHCYLGLMLNGFPNLYFLTAPGSPSVLVNFNVHNVFHVDVVADLLGYMNQHGYDTVQPTLAAQEEYEKLTQRVSDGLLRKKVDNYMVHVNDDGSRFLIPFAGGWSSYVDIVRKVEQNDYDGFEFTHDGHIVQAPDELAPER